MVLAVTKVGGWVLNEEFFPAQATALDKNITNAVDKRTGQSDTVLSNLTISAPGSVVVDDFTMSSTNRVKLTSRTIQRTIEAPFLIGNWAKWSLSSGQGKPITTAFTPPGICAPIRVPHGATITEVGLDIVPSALHVGAITGGNMAAIQLVRIIPNGAPIAIGSLTFDSGAFPANNAQHILSQTGLSEVVDRTVNRYSLYIQPEGSLGNSNGALLSMQLNYAYVKYTITAMDED